MDADHSAFSKPVRIFASIFYASALCALAVWMEKSRATVPAIMIALGLPLVFRLVPRNYFYGMRSRRTLYGTDETWYIQNMITGVAMVLAGAVWLVVLAVRG